MDLLELTDAEFDAESRERTARLKAQASADAVRRVYKREVFPLERARIQRAAKASNEPPLELLFVTVGRQAQSPLLAILASPAEYIILLHTDDTIEQANEVVNELALTAAQAELVSLGKGDRPLALYREIDECWRRRGRPGRVAVDLTGGLKTMSAAAAAAGFALPGARVYYIESEQIRLHGQLVWLNERRVEVDNPYEVFGDIRRKTALELLRGGRYGVAAGLYRQLDSDLGDSPPDRRRALLAEGYDAIESMDFKMAQECLAKLWKALDHEAKHVLGVEGPLLKQRRHIEANARGASRLAEFVELGGKGDDPTREIKSLRDERFLDFLAMLICSAKRHRKEGKLDIAALLAYRALEAAPQRRLAAKGLSPSSMDWQALAAAAGRPLPEILADYNERSSTKALDPEHLPEQLARAAAFLLLAVAFPDDLARGEKIERFRGLGTSRNKSLLAHGVSQLDCKAVEGLIRYARELTERVLELEGLGQGERDDLWRRHTFIEL